MDIEGMVQVMAFRKTGVTHLKKQILGWWRSPVAHLYGVQGVAGSNPVHPTSPALALAMAGFFIYNNAELLWASYVCAEVSP